MSAWFDKTDYVKRYSPFGVMQNMQGVNQMNALMSPQGSITSLGNWVSLSSGVQDEADSSTSTPRNRHCVLVEKSSMSESPIRLSLVSIRTLSRDLPFYT